MPRTSIIKTVKPWKCIAHNIKVFLAIYEKQPQWLADRLGIDKRTVNRWIAGEYPPPVDELFRVAEVLKTTPARLVTPVGEDVVIPEIKEAV